MAKDNEDDLVVGKFPGDQDKPIRSRGKLVIYLLPPFLIGGLAWLFGIRQITHWVTVTVVFSGMISVFLYVIFFVEMDFFQSLRDFFRRR